MKKEFQCKYTINESMYKSWIKENIYKTNNLIFLIFCLIMGILSILLLFKYDDIMGLFYFIICVYFLILRFIIIPKKQLNRAKKIYGADEWESNIVFTDEKIKTKIVIKEKDTKFESSFDYKDIKEIIEKDNYIRIVFNNKSLLRLYSDCFVNSKWKDCKKMILDKK